MPQTKTGERSVPRKLQSFLISMLLAGFVGCTSSDNPQDLKEKTARETATMKRDAKAVAEGIREGWSRDRPLDLNTASKDDLMALPGVDSAEADRIIAVRPFREPDELSAGTS